MKLTSIALAVSLGLASLSGAAMAAPQGASAQAGGAEGSTPPKKAAAAESRKPDRHVCFAQAGGCTGLPNR